MPESRKILVVEDEETIRLVLYEAFREEGYEVICAEDAEEALRLLTPDIKVMFLDLKLTGDMDGIDLCKRIRENNKSACIYALTGHSTLYELSDCREAGFDDYFTKPAKLEMLLMSAKEGFDKVDRSGKKQ